MPAQYARREDRPSSSSQRRDARKPSGPAPRYPASAADVLSLQRSAGNAVVTRLLSEDRTPVQRFAVYQPGHAQYPALHGEALHGEEEESGKFFPSQHKKDDEWVGPDKKPHIRYTAGPTLQISENFDLAIEADTEAKCFYATQHHVDEANKNLKGIISFITGPKRLAIALPSGGNIELLQVIPKSKEDGLEGLAITTAQRCEVMARDVTGQKDVIDRISGFQLVARILDEMRSIFDRLKTGSRGSWSERLRISEANDCKGDDKTKFYRFIETMVHEFEARRKNDPKTFERAIKKLDMNQHARLPQPGDVMATTGVMPHDQIADKKEKGEFFFQKHFGGVVAVSGEDFITMENYARIMRVGIDSGDPLFFFKMYGPQHTWHAAMEDTGYFGGAVISITMGP